MNWVMAWWAAEDSGVTIPSVLLPSVIGLISALVGVVFGGPFLNRRNAERIAKGQASKDEATATQVLTDASVSLIEEWRLIANAAKTELAETSRQVQSAVAEVNILRVQMENARKRAEVAELQAAHAGRRAAQAERALHALTKRVKVLESYLRENSLDVPEEGTGE